MTTISLEIRDEEVKHMLARIVQRVEDLTPVMRKIAGIMADSVEENFARGGRPTKWPQSQRAKAQGGQTLQDSGRLAASLTQRADATSAEVGTNVKYAAVHHFGAKKGSFGTFVNKVKSHPRMVAQAFGKRLPQPVMATVRAHNRNVKLPWGDIPARPFLMVQDEDWAEIKAAMAGYLEGK